MVSAQISSRVVRSGGFREVPRVAGLVPTLASGSGEFLDGWNGCWSGFRGREGFQRGFWGYLERDFGYQGLCVTGEL